MDKDKLQHQINRFLKYKDRKWKPSTKRNKRYYFGRLQDFLGEKPFNRDTIEEFFTLLAVEGKAESVRRQTEVEILAFITWLFEEGVIEKNWGKRIGRTKIHPKPRILPSQSELLKLARKATKPGKYDNKLTRFSKREHLACISFIVTACGGRNYETRNIKRNDVSISGREILLEKGKNGERIVTIPEIPWLVKDLTKRVKGQRTKEELSVLNDRTHFRESDIDRLFVVSERKLQQTMNKTGGLWGRPLTVHDLRRIFARDMKANGADLHDIMKAMGHKSIETTLRYLYDDPSEVKRIVNRYSSEARRHRPVTHKLQSIREELGEKAWIEHWSTDQNGKVHIVISPK